MAVCRRTTAWAQHHRCEWPGARHRHCQALGWVGGLLPQAAPEEASGELEAPLLKDPLPGKDCCQAAQRVLPRMGCRCLDHPLPHGPLPLPLPDGCFSQKLAPVRGSSLNVSHFENTKQPRAPDCWDGNIGLRWGGTPTKPTTQAPVHGKPR